MFPRKPRTTGHSYRSPDNSSSRSNASGQLTRYTINNDSVANANDEDNEDGSDTGSRGQYDAADSVHDAAVALQKRLQLSSDAESINWNFLDGGRKYAEDDPKTRVQTNWQVFTVRDAETGGPVNQRPGERSTFVRVTETPGRTETRYPEYKKRDRDYFKFGLVIEVLLVVSRTSGVPTLTHLTPGQQRFTGNTRVRRFAIIRATTNGLPGFLALPLQTYGGLGVACPGVVKSNHTMIHTTYQAPDPTPAEEPRRLAGGSLEDPMLRPPIKVDPKRHGDALDRMTRLNYGKPHGFDYGVKVRTFGWIADSSREPFDSQFRWVWHRRIPYALEFHNADDTHDMPPQGTSNTAPGSRPSASSSRVPPHSRTDSGTSITIDHANTPEQVQEALVQLREYAHRAGLPAPPPIDDARAKFLAANPAYRMAWIGTVREQWTAVWRQRRDQANTEAGDEEEDDDDDDEEEEEEEEEEAEDDDDDEDEDNEEFDQRAR